MLLAQIETLKAQIAKLVGTNTVSQATAQQIRHTFRFSTPLHMGMSGEEVRKLQKMLSTDPTLFSESNITGFFGPLTAAAVSQFQQHFGIDAIGVVGPKTMQKINELLNASNVRDEEDLDDHEFGDLDDESEGGVGDDDFDNDGIKDTVDTDDDNDGVTDAQDNDDDNDGITDANDNDDDNDGQNDNVDSGTNHGNNGVSHGNNATSSSERDD